MQKEEEKKQTARKIYKMSLTRSKTIKNFSRFAKEMPTKSDIMEETVSITSSDPDGKKNLKKNKIISVPNVKSSSSETYQGNF